MTRITDSDGVEFVTDQLEIEAAQWDGVFSYEPRLGFSGEPDEAESDEAAAEAEKADVVETLVSVFKASVNRVYVSSPDDAPDDADVQQGDQGGYYYVPSDDTDLGSSQDTTLEEFGVDSLGDVPVGTEITFEGEGYGSEFHQGYVVGMDGSQLEVQTPEGSFEVPASRVSSLDPSHGPPVEEGVPEDRMLPFDRLALGDIVQTEVGGVLEVHDFYELANGEEVLVGEDGDGNSYELTQRDLDTVLSAAVEDAQERDAPDDLADLEVGDTLAYEPPWADATQEATVEEIDEEYDEVRLDVDGEPRYVFPEDFGSSVFYDEEDIGPTHHLAALTEDEPDEQMPLFQHSDSASGVSADDMTVERYGDIEVFVTETAVRDDESVPQTEREEADRALATFHLSKALGGRVPQHNFRVVYENANTARMEVMGVGVGDVRDVGSLYGNHDDVVEKVDREDYVRQAAIQYLAGNSDAHPDNVRIGSEGEVYMTDLDHSAGDFTQNEEYRNRGLSRLESTAEYLGLSTDTLEEDIRAEAEELAQELHGTEEFEDTLDRIEQFRQDAENVDPDSPQAYQYEDNLRANVEAFAEEGGY